MNVNARQRATAHYRAAASAIDNVFDRAEQLAVARAAIAALVAAEPDDVIANVVDVLAATDRLRSELDELRGAATVAVEYSSQRQLAGDLGTRQSLLFPASPHAGRRREATSPDPTARSSAGPTSSERPLKQALGAGPAEVPADAGAGGREPGPAPELSVADG